VKGIWTIAKYLGMFGAGAATAGWGVGSGAANDAGQLERLDVAQVMRKPPHLPLASGQHSAETTGSLHRAAT